MGAVQRLATVVIIGLVALSTVLFLYLADESNRQDAEVKEQDDAAIERGTANYLQYCLPCHGPAGEGYEEGTGRIGAPLGGTNTSLNQEGVYANGTPYPGGFSARTSLINKTIHNGRGAMPIWGAENGGELNDDQIDNLTYMIQHVDWNAVYNAAIEQSGGYPTVAPTSAPTVAPTPSAGAAKAHLEAYDIGWRESELQIGTGPQKIEITNTGATLHDFTIAELNIKVDLQPGTTTTVDIDAPAGEYEYYCSVPGHKEAGMVGKLIVEEGGARPRRAVRRERRPQSIALHPRLDKSLRSRCKILSSSRRSPLFLQTRRRRFRFPTPARRCTISRSTNWGLSKTSNPAKRW